MGGEGTLYRPQGAFPGLGKKILDSNMCMPYKFAMGTWEVFHVKSRDTVFRFSGSAKGDRGTLYRPQGESPGLRKKILHRNLGMANKFAI